MLTLRGSDIPAPLRVIPQPPKLLYALSGDSGPRDILDRPLVAIVGTRSVSAYGCHVTHLLATELAKLGIGIVSGLALGVDSIAHEAALQAGGTTIAVVPGGIDQIYPRSHEQLARRIVANNGLLLSEHPGAYKPTKYDFLIRNRLVSGLGDALIVTEAAERSGTLNTVGHALEQGKTVFAVPGNITSPTSVGTNQLLKSGAIALTDPLDVLREMGWETIASSHSKRLSYKGTELEMKLLVLIEGGVTSGEELIQKSNDTYQACNQALTMLEIAGEIKSGGANTWMRV